MRNKFYLLPVAFILISLNAYSQTQTFTEIPANIPGYSHGATDWGDYDNDGDLDVLICGLNTSGIPESAVYRNNGNNTFSRITSIILTGLYYSDCTWQDYDLDGDLDIMLSGRDQNSLPATMIYRNNGSNSFSLQSGINLQALNYSSIDWGDYDNDGDPDILLTGRNQSNIPVSLIYRNNRNNTFSVQSGISLTGVYIGESAWADYDGDGDLDILITGYNSTLGQAVSKIYMNNGDNSFSEQTGIYIDEVYYSSVSWGDYNDDWYPDLLLTGYSTALGQPITRVYKNNGNNTFSNQAGIILPGVYLGSARWGDYDNDGDTDIMLTGYNSSGIEISEIYRNNGNNTFTQEASSLVDVYYSKAEWGDFDNDLDIDLLVSGYDGSGRTTRLYSNNSAVANTPPTAPRNLKVELKDDGFTFSWDGSNDNETRSVALGYNIRIGTAPGMGDIKSAETIPGSSLRIKVNKGNVGQRYYWTFKGIPPGTYYWSVQSVDNAYLGSPFAEEDTLEVIFTEAPFQYDGEGTPYPFDFDRDGDLDILANNSSGTTIFRNDLSTGGGFTDINAGIPFSYDGDFPFALGDYDNDGDVDIAHSERGGAPDYAFITSIYRNDNGSFTRIENDMEGIWMGKIAWGDYDNDGDLDLFLYGNSEQSDDGEPLGILYRNDGNDIFTDSGIYIEDARRGAVALADYNRDSYLDILTCGYNLSQNIFTSVLRNNQGVSFSNIDAGIDGYSYGDLDWGDYDNDGLLDIFVTGALYGGSGSTRIFHNNGNETFSDIGLNIPGDYSYTTTAEWGDFDNDGDLDIIYSGSIYSSEASLIRNEGNHEFIPVDIGLYPSSCRWADIDNDGDLDILANSGIFINRTNSPNSEPSVPAGLRSSISADQANLSWDAAGDDITPTESISYNVCVGTSPGNWDILSPMTANSPGYSKAIPGMGNAFNNTNKIIRNLPTGIYYWTVQSVDNGFMTSDFAPVESFEILSMFTKTFAESWGDNNVYFRWGDYNNDGAPDFIGSEYSNIDLYRNDGNDSFTIVDPGIRDSYSNLDWIDFDNDGDLDLMSADSLYRNDPGNVFVNTGIYFEFINYDYVTGDYDADGDIDIFSDNKYIYRNDGNTVFTPIPFEITDNIISFNWFDYDNDGDLDPVVIHGNYQDYTTSIFRNDGNNNFVTIQSNIVGLNYASISFADIDNDNDLDLYLGGEDENFNYLTRLYRNDGEDTFTEIDANLRGYSRPDSFWGDLNNDGNSDFIISGWNNGRTRNKLYLNNMNSTFDEVDIEDIIEYIKVFDLADYDNDGDLDALTNRGVFRNNTNHDKDIPPELTGLSSDLQGLDCRLYWERANDPKEPGYSYNIKIGTSPGGTDIKSPLSGPGTGNVPTDTSWVIRDLAPGLYYWTVQGVNQNFNAGPWAPVKSFLITDVSPDFTYDTVCFRESTTFTDLSVTTDVIVEWNWDFGDGNISTEQNPVHEFLIADTFNVELKVFSQSGDSATRVRPVIVKPAPDALFSVMPVCKDDPSILINQSTIDNIVIDTWQWDFGNGEYSDVQNTVQKVYVSTDTAILTIIANNGCWDADTQLVRIAEYPDATLSLLPGYSNIFCDGDSTIVTAPYNSTYNYQWLLNGANILSANDTSLLIKGPGGKYSVEIENPEALCLSSDSIQVTVNSAPASPVINADGPLQFCEGDSVILSVSYNPDYIYQWKLNGGAFGGNTNDLIVKSGGNYNLVVSNSSGCEAISANSIQVSVNPLPVVPTVSINGNTTFCEGSSIEMSTPLNSDYTYQWTNNNNNITGETTNTYTVVNSGVFALEITNLYGCASKTEDVAVTVIPSPASPNISVNGANEFCEGDSAILSVAFNSDYTYQWLLNGGATGFNSNEYIVKSNGTYTVLVRNSGGCETLSSNSEDFIVNSSPVVPALSINGNTTFCQGNSVDLSIPDNPSYTYQWTNDGNNISNATSNSYNVLSTGTYALTVTNTGGCMGSTEDVLVTVNPSPVPPNISIIGSQEFCEGDSAKLSVPFNSDFTYQWKLNGGAVGTDSNEYIARFQGNISLDITNSGGCSVSSSNNIDIKVNPVPDASNVNLSGPTEFCQGGNLIMSVIDNPSYTYQWRNEYGIVPGATSTSYQTDVTGVYTLDISNASACIAQTIPVNVIVKPVPDSPVLQSDNYIQGECLGTEPVKLYPDYTQAGLSYQWLRNGTPIAFATGDYLEGFLSEGDYSLRVDQEGCTSESNTLTLEFADAPLKPDLYVKGPVVWYMAASNDTAAYYKWYLNNDLIQSADKYLYVANQQLGTYKVAIGNQDGCFTMSDEITIPVDLNRMTDFHVPDEFKAGGDIDPFASLKIYPNPTPGVFTIEMDNNLRGELITRIFAGNAVEILNIKFDKSTSHFKAQVDLSGQGKGAYIIIFTLDRYKTERKLIIE